MNYLWALVVFAAGEIVSFFIFGNLKKRLGPQKDNPANRWSTVKGIVERLTIYTGLLHQFPQIIIAFAALKLGTRLHEEKECEISNTYFLVGNLISILLALIYTIITKAIWKV